MAVGFYSRNYRVHALCHLETCSSYKVGFLQTVHRQWLHYYFGSRGNGSIIERVISPLPIRDGNPGMIWYSSAAQAKFVGCNTPVQVTLDDYPTIFFLQKYRNNIKTNKRNYLTGVSRGMHFVAFLVAQASNGSIIPLKYFYWNFHMDITFSPNYNNLTSLWLFQWKKNRSVHSRLFSGASRSVPFFTVSAPRYNDSLTTRLRYKI